VERRWAVLVKEVAACVFACDENDVLGMIPINLCIYQTQV
jgi:hypothetical protein